MSVLPEDIKYMKFAIELAKRAVGTTFPNPPVGCVIVKDGRIISACHTQPQGKTHAEVSAINKAKPEDIRGATMYVTMEPCSHFGKSPPCVNSIIPSGIKKVVIANLDVNPKVNGGGIKALKDAGIEVITGICEKEAMEVNYPFFRSITQKLPYVTLKMGASLDGKIALANGKSKWVTSEHARHYSQMLRYRNDAILVGVNTIIQDDPSLTLRLEGLEKYSPIRVVIDKELKTPQGAKILQDTDRYKTIIFTKENSEISSVNPDYLDLRKILANLSDQGVCRVLLEGGSSLATSFLKENLIDEIQIISSPKIFGSDAISIFGNLELNEINESNFVLKETRRLGNNSLTIYVKNTSQPVSL